MIKRIVRCQFIEKHKGGAEMYMTSSKKLYCPWCKIYFSDTGEAGPVPCPVCKKKRDDGLNQTSEYQFQCVDCRCEFSHMGDSSPQCPNKCLQGGRKYE